MTALDVEIESGTYSGQVRQHNGYYAGDFHASATSMRPMRERVEIDADSQRRERRAVISGARRIPYAA